MYLALLFWSECFSYLGWESLIENSNKDLELSKPVYLRSVKEWMKRVEERELSSEKLRTRRKGRMGVFLS